MDINEKQEKRIMLLLSAVFFGIFLYIEFNFFPILRIKIVTVHVNCTNSSWICQTSKYL